MTTTHKPKKRILTGDNATGKLHLGHYVGSLENRVRLQNEYETFLVIADMHSLAYPRYVEQPQVIAESTLELVKDYMAVGLDPDKVTVFPESSIPEMYQLGIIFSMLVTHNRALRNPTLKEEIKVKEMGDNYSLGFINFPILQVADILSVKADLVPVGEDQLPHLELTNEVARKFNNTYSPVLKEIEPMIGRIKRLVGLDGGAKMSKSLGNTIYLSEDEKTLKQKIMSMFTDPNRIHPTDPGKVEGNPVFIYHEAFNPNIEEINDLKARYTKGTVGDVEVKEKLFNALNTFLEPMRECRAHYEARPELVKDILMSGAHKTRKIVQSTLKEVTEAMKLPNYL